MTAAPKAAAAVMSVRTLAFLEMWFTTRYRPLGETGKGGRGAESCGRGAV